MLTLGIAGRAMMMWAWQWRKGIFLARAIGILVHCETERGIGMTFLLAWRGWPARLSHAYIMPMWQWLCVCKTTFSRWCMEPQVVIPKTNPIVPSVWFTCQTCCRLWFWGHTQAEELEVIHRGCKYTLDLPRKFGMLRRTRSVSTWLEKCLYLGYKYIHVAHFNGQTSSKKDSQISTYNTSIDRG